MEEVKKERPVWRGDDGVGWLLRELREKGGGTTPAARQIFVQKLPGRVVARLVRGLWRQEHFFHASANDDDGGPLSLREFCGCSS